MTVNKTESLVVFMGISKIIVTIVLFLSLFAPYSQAEEVDREERRQKLLEKMEKRAKALCEDSSKLCKKYISSNETSEKGRAYKEAVLAKIRLVAKGRYPRKLAEDGRYGTTVFSVEINRDGSLRKVMLVKKSNIGLINDFSLRLVKDSAPYIKLDGFFDESVDVVVLTEAMHFNFSNRGENTEVMLGTRD